MEKSNRYRFVIEALVLLILTCIGVIWVATGPILSPMMEDYGISRGTVSWSASIAALVVVFFSVPSGILCSKIGIRKTFAIGAFLMSVGFLTPLCTSFLLLLATRLIFAIGTAMTFPIAGGIVTQWFTSKELPLINGLNVSSTSVGNTVALFATVPIASLLSWRAPLTIYGVIALIGAVLWFFLGRERQTVPVAQDTKREPVAALGTRDVFKLKAIWYLALSMVGPFCLSMAISSWLPTYYNEEFGIPLVQASSITALFTVAGIPACILGGLLPMWLGRRKPFLIIPGALIGFAGLGTFIINNPLLNISCVILFGICVQIYMPSIFTITMELPGMSARTVALALAVGTAMGDIGGFVGPLLVGYTADATASYIPGFVGCCVLSSSLLVGGLLLPETGPKAKKAEQTLPDK